MVANMPQEMKSGSAITNRAWRATVMTLFPEMFPGSLGQSLAGKALDEGIWAIEAMDIRSFAEDKHQTVDDTPFGGGAGMVMRADVIDAALKSVAKPKNRPIIYLTPRGKPLDQKRVKELSAEPGVVLLCGRYEGVDDRVINAWDMEEISLGDFVLSGGEPAALSLIDAVVRLLPGVVGNEKTSVEESFEGGLLEYPHYTRPQVWKEREVPEVLLSGHHEKVKVWRQAEAEKITAERRPDLWEKYKVKDGTKLSNIKNFGI
jgi:tRNA (guanine37-N1)-methyltransferase